MVPSKGDSVPTKRPLSASPATGLQGGPTAPWSLFELTPQTLVEHLLFCRSHSNRHRVPSKVLPSFADSLKGSPRPFFLEARTGPRPLPGWVPPHSHPFPLAKKKKKFSFRPCIRFSQYPTLIPSQPRLSKILLPLQADPGFAGGGGQTSGKRKRAETNSGSRQCLGVKDPSPATTLNDQLTKEAPRVSTCKAA